MKTFQQPSDVSFRGDPYTWPLVSWATDGGSNGVCALNYLPHKANVNVDGCYDFNHGSWDDEKQTIKDMHEHSWLLMMLISFNVMDGPYGTCERYQTTKTCVTNFYARMGPEQSPLFLDVAPLIIQAQGWPAGEEENLIKAWILCGPVGPLLLKNYMCNLNKLHGFTERAEEEMELWWGARVPFAVGFS